METIIQQIDYTVIVPVYNSENTLQALFDRTKAVFESLDKSFEMIFVEDGGKDNSWKVLTQIQKQNKNYVSAFRLNRNYGQHNATFCGMDHARGDYVITIDDDLQTPPEEIKNSSNQLKQKIHRM